jgi:hypothetical protein
VNGFLSGARKMVHSHEDEALFVVILLAEADRVSC